MKQHLNKEALINKATGELANLELCVSRANINDYESFQRLYPVYRDMQEVLRGLETLPITEEDMWAFGYDYPLYDLYRFTPYCQHSHCFWPARIKKWFEEEVVSRRSE